LLEGTQTPFSLCSLLPGLCCYEDRFSQRGCAHAPTEWSLSPFFFLVLSSRNYVFDIVTLWAEPVRSDIWLETKSRLSVRRIHYPRIFFFLEHILFEPGPNCSFKLVTSKR